MKLLFELVSGLSLFKAKWRLTTPTTTTTTTTREVVREGIGALADMARAALERIPRERKTSISQKATCTWPQPASGGGGGGGGSGGGGGEAKWLLLSLFEFACFMLVGHDLLTCCCCCCCFFCRGCCF